MNHKKWVTLSECQRELLDRLYPQPGQCSGAEEMIGDGQNIEGSSEGSQANEGNSAESGDVADPMAGWTSTAMSAAKRRALVAATGGAISDSFEWEQAADEWFDGGILGGGSTFRHVAFRQDCYDQVWPAFKRVARDLATRPPSGREEGCLTGGRMSRPPRAAIDGRCFRRSSWEDGPDAAVAVVFDQSESMAECLDVFLPVGAALADALRSAPNVEVAIWRYGARVERVKRVADLRQGVTMGETATHLAMREAASWLETKSARRRAVILFTDGEPNDVAATSEAVIRLRRTGTVLLVGAIGLSELDCARSMPGGVVFSVDPRDAGSSLHVAANRLRRLQ